MYIRTYMQNWVEVTNAQHLNIRIYYVQEYPQLETIRVTLSHDLMGDNTERKEALDRFLRQVSPFHTNDTYIIENG